ncbi:MAG: bacteriocin fulvocin C-related protein [bacterium]
MSKNSDFAQVPTRAQIPNTDDELLRAYSALNSLSLVDRKIVFRQACPKEKSNLWKLHLALSMIKRPGLTEQQQAVVLEAMSFASAEVFELRGKDLASKTEIEIALQALTSRAMQIFSKEEGAQIFSQLGGSAGSSPEMNASLPRSLVKTAHGSSRATCGCSHSSDWCWIVCSGGVGCEHTDDGCGTLWRYACDGQCWEY